MEGKMREYVVASGWCGIDREVHLIVAEARRTGDTLYYNHNGTYVVAYPSSTAGEVLEAWMRQRERQQRLGRLTMTNCTAMADGVEVPVPDSMSPHPDRMDHKVDMQRQVDLFMAGLPELLAKYEGKHVAFWEGRVLAVGNTLWEALDAVNELRRNHDPILCRRVQAEYPPIEM